jgi:hypothetical protein
MRCTRPLWPVAFVICLVALAASAPAASAAVRNAVPAGGVDTGDCPADAPCTLEFAVNFADDGDEVVVDPGDYTVPAGGLLVNTSVRVHGRPGEAAPVLTQAAANVPAVQASGAEVTLSDLDIRLTATGPGRAVDVQGNVTLDRVAVRSASSFGVFIGSGQSLNLLNSTVHATGASIGVLDAGTLTMVNTTVVTTAAGTEALHLAGSTGDPATASVRNSILDAGAIDVLLQPNDPGAASLTIDHSNYDDLLSQNGAVVNAGAGNQTGAPLFLNRNGGDLRQAQNSPTIDAGVTDPLAALDLEGEGRPSGAAPDIGADERYPDGPVRYAAPGATGRGFCTAPAAACAIKRAVEDVPADGDEVVILPGTYELESTLEVAHKIDVHGPADGPRPLITNAFTGGNLVELQAGAGTRLADMRLHNDVDNVVTVLSLGGGGVNIDRVVATADGTDAHAVLIRAGDTISNSVAWGRGMGAIGVSAESTSGGDIPTVRDVTAIAEGPAINFTATGAGNTLVLRNVIADGATDVQINVDDQADQGTVDVLNSNFSSVDTDGQGTGSASASPTNQLLLPPQFVDARGGDFHQLPTSPTIDAGFDSPGANGPLDFEGDARILGTKTDIGADEFRPMPAVTTGEASAVGREGATLSGSAQPQRLGTTVRFEYGTDTGYGSQTAPQDAGGGDAAVPFSAAVTGLSPGTTYHHRAVATNSGGTGVGDDRTFTTAAAPPPPNPPGDHTAPVVRSFAATNTTFRVGMPAMARRKVPVGTVFRYRISEDARVTVTIARAVPGRRVGGRCVKPTRANRARRPCDRFVRVGALRQDAQAGANSRGFSGKFGRRRLQPGRYLATIVAVDLAGNRSNQRRLNLRVVP